MYQKALSLLLIFSLAFNIAFVGIWAYNRTHPPARAARPPAATAQVPVPASLEGLSLTPDQRRQVVAAWRAAVAQTARVSAEVARERQRLFELMAAPEPDKQAIQACEQRIEAGQTRLGQLALNQMRQISELLTPAQRQAWFQMMTMHAERAARRGRALEGQPPGSAGPPGPQGPEAAPGPRRPARPAPRQGGARPAQPEQE
jgi:Spy/CpxP family protein refolding chaperone